MDFVRFWTFIIWAWIMNTRNHRNLCKGIEKVAGFTSSGQGGERFLCDWSNGRFADGNVGLTNLDKFPMWLIWQQICGFANGNVGLTNLDKLKKCGETRFQVGSWQDQPSRSLLCRLHALWDGCQRARDSGFYFQRWQLITARLKNPETRIVRSWYLLR